MPDVVGRKVGGGAGSAWVWDWPSVWPGIEDSIPGWDPCRGHVVSRSGTKASA